jgi:hypothetical protein
MVDVALKSDLQLHVFWACVVLAVARMAAKAAEVVASKSVEAARLTGETAVRASEATGARAAAALAAAVAEPARRSAEAVERLTEVLQDFRRAQRRACRAKDDHRTIASQPRGCLPPLTLLRLRCAYASA